MSLILKAGAWAASRSCRLCRNRGFMSSAQQRNKQKRSRMGNVCSHSASAESASV
jgi:hypothetical protein